MPEPRDHLVLVLDVGRSRRRARDRAARRSRGSDGQGRLRALRRGRPRGLRGLAGQRLPGLRRPQAPRHPEHRRARRARRSDATASSFLNFHAAGGVDDVARRRRRSRTTARRDAGHDAPIALAVTVLTSEPNVDALDATHASRARRGVRRRRVRGHRRRRSRARLGLRTMVPGIRLAGGDANDQARVDTPGDAIARGADWLVIGRAVTGADDPERAAVEVTRAVARRALGRTAGPDRLLRRDASAYTGRRRRPGGRRMPLPPALTAEQRQAALQKAAEARRQRAEVKAKLKAGLARSRRAVRPGHARRRAREAQGGERARVAPRRRQGAGAPDHGRARHQREPSAPRARPQPARRAALPPQDRPQRLSLDRWQSCCSCIAGPSGVGKGTVVAASCSSATRASGCRSRPRPAPPRPARSTASTTASSTREEFEAAARRRRLPRVVRGLRRPEGHAPRPGRGAPRRRARTCCSRSTCRARWRSGEQFPERCWCSCRPPSPRSSAGACVAPRAPTTPRTLERRLAAAAAEEAQAGRVRRASW